MVESGYEYKVATGEGCYYSRPNWQNIDKYMDLSWKIGYVIAILAICLLPLFQNEETKKWSIYGKKIALFIMAMWLIKSLGIGLYHIVEGNTVYIIDDNTGWLNVEYIIDIILIPILFVLSRKNTFN